MGVTKCPTQACTIPDLVDWARLFDIEYYFNYHVLAFFAASNGIVNKNLSSNITTEVKTPLAHCFYDFQLAVENIHSKTNSLLINAYIKDPKDKLHLLHAIKTVPGAQCKANWALRWCPPIPVSERMFAFAAVKGIFFWGSFCAIFWLKKCGLMPGLSFSNTNLSVRMKGSTATLHASFTLN